MSRLHSCHLKRSPYFLLAAKINFPFLLLERVSWLRAAVPSWRMHRTVQVRLKGKLSYWGLFTVVLLSKENVQGFSWPL